MVSPPQLRFVAQQDPNSHCQERRACITTMSRRRDNLGTHLGTPILARANWIFGWKNSKFRKKLFVAVLEYLFTTQIREGFSLDSKLSVVGCFEFDPGDNKNLGWISQNALVRSAQKGVLDTLSTQSQ